MAPDAGESPEDVLGGGILAHVIEGAPVGFGMHDAEGRVTYANRYLTCLLGFKAGSELIGRQAASFVCDEDRDDYQRLVERGPADRGDPYSLRLTRTDGTHVRVLVRPAPIFGDSGEIVAEAAFILDVAVLEATGASPRSIGVDKALLKELTAREREVFNNLVEGKSVRAIAELNQISEHTVRNHVKSIYRKLGLHSRIDLMRAALGK